MRLKYFVGLFVIFFHVLASAKSANILSLAELLEPDQQIWHDALYKGLIARGHTILMVSGSNKIFNNKSPQLKQIHLEQLTTTTIFKENNSPKIFTNSWLSPFEEVFYWYNRQMKICKSSLSSDGIEELLELANGSAEEPPPPPFDLILFDATYGPSCLLALTQLFENVPIVAVSGSNISPDLLSLARGAHLQPATIPHFTTAHSERMNFFQRLHNTVVYAIGNFLRRFLVASVQEAILVQSEVFGKAHISPKLENIIDRIKVVLVNSHPAIDFVHSLPPNIIEVGGLQFDDINRAVSVEMQTFIGNSKEGVFVITLGHRENSDILTNKLIDYVINTVDRYPEYGFIWGVDHSKLPPGSGRGNLFVGGWFKRSVILAQHRVKGLIIAGGHMEIQEAVYNGVPIIGVSEGLNNNLQRIHDLGFGINVDLNSDPDESLSNAIKALIEESKFKENAKSRQLAFRNRPQSPLDVALWWIEHVSAHPTESGLLFSQAAADESFFVFHSIDVFCVFVILLGVFFINCYIVLKQFTESCKSKPKIKTDNNNKSISLKHKSKRTESNMKKKSQ